MHEVILYGSGSVAREVFEFELSQRVSTIKFIGYINDGGSDRFFESNTGLSRLSLDNAKPGAKCLPCIADPVSRAQITKRIIQAMIPLFSYVHPTALISRHVLLPEGCIVYPYVVISTGARLGRCVILNTYVGIGHDTEVGDFCTLSAHVDLTGGVKVGEYCFFGSGARVAPGKTIGSHSKIGLGVSVIRSLRAKTTLLPSPNKLLL